MAMINVRCISCEAPDADMLYLPCKDSKLEESLKLISPGGSGRITISEVFEPLALKMLEGMTVDAFELNFLAKSIGRLDHDTDKQFFAAVGMEKCTSLKDLINVSLNIGRYTVIQDLADLETEGKSHYVNLHEDSTVEEWLTVDFRKLALDLLTSGKGIPTEYGLLFLNEEVPFQEVYDGVNFPPLYYGGNIITVMQLSYDGRSEYLCLPAERVTIDRTLDRLGAPSLEDCTAKVKEYVYEGSVWKNCVDETLKNEGLHGLNRLAGLFAQPDVKKDKLHNVIEYAGAVDSGEVARLASHLDDFIVLHEVEDEMEVVEYFTTHDETYRAAPDILTFIDKKALADSLEKEREAGSLATILSV